MITFVSGSSPRISLHASTPFPSGRRDVHHDYVRPRLARRADGLSHATRFAHDGKSFAPVKQRLQPHPDDFVVVYEENRHPRLSHPASPFIRAAGSCTIMRVPTPGSLSIMSFAPIARARSLMLRRPCPSLPAPLPVSKPAPLSSTDRATP